MIGFDLYPLQEWCQPNRMADVFFAQRELVKLSGDKPTFQWIEADDWKCPGGATASRPATVRAESWLAIAGGAHGLGFWPAQWPVGSSRVIARSPATSRASARRSTCPNLPATSDQGKIQVVARNWGGALYVFAINSSYHRSDATITSRS